MSKCRNLIIAIVLSALTMSVVLHGQSAQAAERNALYVERMAAQQHVQPGQRQQVSPTEETNVRNAPLPDRANAMPVQVPVANTTGRVIPGSNHAVPASAPVVPGHVNAAPARAHAASIPAARPAAVKEVQAVVRPVVEAPLHTVPGSRANMGRPVIVQRALPSSIAIDVRSANCPYVTVTPWAISKKGDYIELNDGSLWKVRHRNRKAVKKWGAGDAILIETGGFFSWYAYKLVNYTRNETADVELSLVQGWQGRSAHQIIEVNPFDGYVRLEDGSIWRMSSRELGDWHVHDDVIIAVNKDWFSQRYSYVLVNPRVKNRFIASFSLEL